MIRDEEMKEWMKVLASEKLRPMTDEEYEASGLRDIFSESPVEPEEYVFDDGDNPFEDDVAFNGLVDGAGEFPLWEKDSHK